jgi:hypothetical protein
MSYVWQEDKLSNQPRLLQNQHKDLGQKERSKLINRMVVKSK